MLARRRSGRRGPSLQRQPRRQIWSHGRTLHRVHSDVAYVVDDESFGMRKMFDHYGFVINLESEGSEKKTHVTLETHYTPRNPMYGLFNKLMIRRQFQKVCAEIVGGLKDFTESRYRAQERV